MTGKIIILNKKAFSLIELMIVIAIIGILVAVALPQFSAMTMDAKRSKAKNDIQVVVEAINKFNNMGREKITMAKQLKRYINNLGTLRDPWGMPYILDLGAGLVLSSGPDGRHSQVKDKTWDDDISIKYTGPFTLIDARLAVNPENLPQDEAYDILCLYFTRPLMSIGSTEIQIDFSPATAAVTDTFSGSSSYADNDAQNGKLFRWYAGNQGFMAADSPFKTLGTARCKISSFGDELVCKFPAGSSGQITTYNKINITGTINNPHPVFRSEDQARAVAAGATVSIKMFDGLAFDYDQTECYQGILTPKIVQLQ